MNDKMTFIHQFIIAILIFFLSSCTSTVEKLSRVGKQPNFSAINVAGEHDQLTINQEAADYEERKKHSNSLWRPGSTTFFRDNRTWRIGDIVTVVVNISDKAELNNSSKQTRTGTDSIGIGGLLGKEDAIATTFSPTGKASNLISTNNNRNHTGSGNISRKESIITEIAAIVEKVMSNGNLFIRGHQEIMVNDELRQLKISGIVRPRDITADNSVDLNNIAEARVSYGGKGVISDVQSPRVGSQIIDIISPF